MTQQRLRVGLVGAGMVAGHHLAAWQKIDAVEIVAVADPNEGQAANRASVFAIPETHRSAAALIDATRPDAVDIATPVDTHGEICRLAADRGVAILCQKPLAPTADEAAAIVADVGQRVRFMVHENWRHRPNYRRVKAWLDGRRIGDVVGANMALRASGLRPDGDDAPPALRRQPFLATIDRLLVRETLIHHLDVLRWLFGPLLPLNATLSRASQVVAGEDTASVQLRAPGEVPVSLFGTMVAADVPPGQQRDSLEIIGTEGTIRLDHERVDLWNGGHETAAWPFDELYAASYEGALREFAGAVIDGRPFESDAADNLMTLRLVDAIYDTAGPVRAFGEKGS